MMLYSQVYKRDEGTKTVAGGGDNGALGDREHRRRGTGGRVGGGGRCRQLGDHGDAH